MLYTYSGRNSVAEMPPKVYTRDLSLPTSTILMTANVIGVDLEQHIIDMEKGEHLTPEFLKMNPQHTVPTLEDDGYFLWDSHAINAYLVGQYGKDDLLYPKDLRKRGIVDQRLHFDNGVLYVRLLDLAKPLLANVEKEASEAKVNGINEAYGFLNTFLEGNQWLAGENMTLADIQTITTATIGNAIVPINAEKFPNLQKWYKRMRGLPIFEFAKPSADYMENLLAPFKVK